MRIKHTLKDNKLEVTIYLQPKSHKMMKDVIFDTKNVLAFCRSRNLPVGTPLTPDVVCSNAGHNCTATWVFSISKEYKKQLTSPKKPATIDKVTKKKPSARSRARSIATRNRNKKKGTEDDRTSPDSNNSTD